MSRMRILVILFMTFLSRLCSYSILRLLLNNLLTRHNYTDEYKNGADEFRGESKDPSSQSAMLEKTSDITIGGKTLASSMEALEYRVSRSVNLRYEAHTQLNNFLMAKDMNLCGKSDAREFNLRFNKIRMLSITLSSEAISHHGQADSTPDND
ncbi:predicted protein [Sclerotinia sclerotiorum 1980 UF-70]|uniref:Uncharacterized protein n=1 Tax=Sclerotinia sclerotiorum (strain ATCC 18683 / 1980 / Ss-1) TaxID=665079 RepID=A7EUC6_SCLS1|nr:predicted protein [Sclerotinia sclerotiorum 1980 UF-70]EDN93068.1 predicted protein [Sclerotinia sclerotiorum 1980 UF-70]